MRSGPDTERQKHKRKSGGPWQRQQKRTVKNGNRSPARREQSMQTEIARQSHAICTIMYILYALTHSPLRLYRHESVTMMTVLVPVAPVAVF